MPSPGVSAEGAATLTGARLAGRPIHPVVVGIPIGLCTFSVLADIIRLAGWGKPVWFDLAFYAIAAGIVGALLAAIAGLMDYVTAADARVRDIAFAHMIAALFVVAIFILTLWQRWNGDHGLFPVALSTVGVMLLGVVGWLGGQMMFVHGTGMEAPTVSPSTQRKVA